MNKNLTHLAFIIDASGSMAPLQSDTIGGFNRILHEQRQASGESHVTLVTFNAFTREVFTDIDAKHVRDLSTDSYVPAGGTALIDAMGETIDRLGRLFAATPEAERPGKVLITIITDGAENSSREYTLDQIKKTVERQRREYSWELVFLGANIDAFAAAQSYGINTQNAYAFASSKQGLSASYSAVSSSLRGYTEGSSATMDSMDLSDVSPDLIARATPSGTHGRTSSGTPSSTPNSTPNSTPSKP